MPSLPISLHEVHTVQISTALILNHWILHLKSNQIKERRWCKLVNTWMSWLEGPYNYFMVISTVRKRGRGGRGGEGGKRGEGEGEKRGFSWLQVSVLMRYHVNAYSTDRSIALKKKSISSQLVAHLNAFPKLVTFFSLSYRHRPLSLEISFDRGTVRNTFSPNQFR